MTNNTSDLIADLVTKWEDSFEIGLNLSPKEICHEHPELEQIVTEQIRKLKRMRWLTSTWDSNASETLDNGTMIADRFRIEGVLGTGGFGTVYRAMDIELLRMVALKIANPNRSDPDTLLTEARKAASLHHPHIVTVHDVGRHEERVFIVSQLVEGRSLKDMAYATKPSIAQIAQWMRQVADALAAAHSSGLVHRDLKPSNIIINKDQQAMVSDFGIAYHADEIDQIEPLTGTLPYMSPEQVQGEPKLMGPKSDIFSLGVMLHELLSGKHPFLSKSSAETIRKITAAKPEPLNDVPVQLKMLCEQCLSLNPNNRPTASGIVEQLNRFLEADKGPTGAFSAILPIVFGSVISLTAGGLAVWQLFPKANNQPSEVETKTEVTNEATPEPTPSESVTSEKSTPASVSEAKTSDRPVVMTPEPEPSDSRPAKVLNSNELNLLSLIDLPAHTIRGQWKDEDGILKVKGRNAAGLIEAAIQIPYQPKGPYKLTLRARRKEYGGIIIPIVFAGRQFGVYVAGGWNGSKIPNTVPETTAAANFFPSTDWHVVTLHVDANGIRCIGDSGASIEWHQGYETVEGRPFDIPDPRGLYLKVYDDYDIDSLTFEERK
jgi:serine/threonine protein kinase